jgi:hypothetical protein
VVGLAGSDYIHLGAMTTATATTHLAADLRDVRRKLEQQAATGRLDDLIELVVELLARMRESNNALSTRLAASR